MEQCRIEELLDLYFEGQTTIMQEQELRRYFSTAQDIPADLAPYKAMFAAFDKAREVTPPPTIVTKQPRSLYKIILGTVASMAACLALGLFVWAGVDNNKPDIVCYIDGIEITDTERAMAEVNRLLGSANNNLATEEVARLLGSVDNDIALAMAAIESMNIFEL